MLSTRKIKRKIRSVQNIKKITRAMEMVSATKFKRVWTKLSAIRPYSSKLKEMTENLLANLKDTGFNHPYLSHARLPKNATMGGQAIMGTLPTNSVNNQTLCIIAISSNKGLCGGYNTNILKTLSNFITSIETTKTIEIVPIGKKVLDFAHRREYKMRDTTVNPYANVNISIAREIINPVIKDYENGLLNEVWFVYSEFINPMLNRPKAQRFLPFIAEDAKTTTPDAQRPDYLFEPQPTELLNLIIPRYLEVIFYRTLLEAYSSEHSARMMAMRSASKNASDVISELTLTFNKARQANITKELLDIVGGAEGMK